LTLAKALRRLFSLIPLANGIPQGEWRTETQMHSNTMNMLARVGDTLGSVVEPCIIDSPKKGNVEKSA